ncbi:CHAT domain-containing protein [Pleurocapsales cyanobacterium LEGE 06147]|nr:CHAT domain-containing protein [Pleurocapsales cyanobacterium LEGE 06147]
MKIVQLLIKISLVGSWILVAAELGRTQTGNMSDVTLPNPVEVIPTPESPTNTPAEIPVTEPNVDNTPETSPTPAAETPTTAEPEVETPTTAETETPVETPTTTEPEVETPTTAETETPVETPTTAETETPVETPTTAETETPVETPTTTEPEVETPTTAETETPVETPTTTEPEVETPTTAETETPVETPTTAETETPVETPTTAETNDEINPEASVDATPALDSETLTNPTLNLDERTTSNVNSEGEAEPSLDINSNVEAKPETNAESDSGLERITDSTDTEEQVAEESQETEAQGETEPQDSQKPIAEESQETEAQDREEVSEQEEAQEEQEEQAEEKKQQSAPEREVDRLAYEVQIQQSSPDIAVQLQEEFQAIQLMSYSGTQLYGQPPSVAQISRRLGELWQQTGKKPVFINVSVQSNQVETFTVLPTLSNVAQSNTSLVASTEISSNELNQPQPTTVRRTIETTSRQILLETVAKFRKEVSDSRKIGQTGYLESAQQLYQWLIAPIEKELQANDIDIIVFSMDSGLRLLPIAALHDGQQFLIEKYAVALVPSFGLTDTRYVNISQSPILAMGASTFRDGSPLPPLPTVPFELNHITRNPRQGEIFLNERFTIENFEAQNRRSKSFKIIHLGTHAAFKTGNFNDSYIQFYDRKLRLPELKEISDELGWSTTDSSPVELLVLSACETALGNEKAELGFAGLAVQAGVKSALASLWYVSDLGTLALMSEFYDRLSTTLIKAEALRQAQLGMLKGNVLVDDGQIRLSNGESLPVPSEFPKGQLELSHPYFWSAFTLIGNWN